MNIFVLDENPEKAAQYHCDKHVVKMILETAQIMSTVAKQKNIPEDSLYKPTHVNHPCVQWAGKNIQNFSWLADLGHYLSEEFTHRFGKIHASSKIIYNLRKRDDLASYLLPYNTVPPSFVYCGYDFNLQNVVESYRMYYIHFKSSFANWTNRPEPNWFRHL